MTLSSLLQKMSILEILACIALIRFTIWGAK